MRETRTSGSVGEWAASSHGSRTAARRESGRTQATGSYSGSADPLYPTSCSSLVVRQDKPGRREDAVDVEVLIAARGCKSHPDKADPRPDRVLRASGRPGA